MIKVEPLTREAFAPFGDVIEPRSEGAFEINDGYTTRMNALAKVESDADVILSIFQGRVRPLTIAMLECHPKGSQSFMPLGGQDWLAVVAPEPTPQACRAFRCKGTQGVQYAKGVWHHPLLVLGEPQDFLVVDRAGDGNNLEEVFFDKPLLLDL